jgi:membrane protease YdiL (CAAX protease family)
VARNLAGIAEEMSPGFPLWLLAQVTAEEALRFQVQTRCGAWIRSAPAGWLAAALVWGLMHVPRYYHGDPQLAAYGVVCIVPIGLLWSAVSHRAGSIWPAVIAHMLNIWGLQNL